MQIEEYLSADMLKQSIIDMPLDSNLYVANVPNDVYHGSLGWSSSHGKKASLSEQRLYMYMQDQKKSGPQSHFVFGELTHDCIRFNQAQIDDLYCDTVTLPKGQTNLGKAMKAVVESGHTLKLLDAGFNLKPEAVAEGNALLDEINGRQVISRTAKREARELADAVLNQYTVKDALNNNAAIYELSIWHKMKDGFIRKCRPDCYLPDQKVVFDWKTIRELVWTYSLGNNRHTFIYRQIKREMDRFDYGFSAGWYMDILDIIDDGAFFFLFADKDALEVYPPYLCGQDELHEERQRCCQAIKNIKSMKSKIVEGKVIEPLSTFLHNDDHIFHGNTKEFL